MVYSSEREGRCGVARESGGVEQWGRVLEWSSEEECCD